MEYDQRKDCLSLLRQARKPTKYAGYIYNKSAPTEDRVESITLQDHANTGKRMLATGETNALSLISTRKELNQLLPQTHRRRGSGRMLQNHHATDRKGGHQRLLQELRLKDHPKTHLDRVEGVIRLNKHPKTLLAREEGLHALPKKRMAERIAQGQAKVT